MFAIDGAFPRNHLVLRMAICPEILCESSPRIFFSRLEKICDAARDVFLMNPQWTAAQREEAEIHIRKYAENTARESGKIFIASGGSGGKVRFVAHTPETLAASARALISALKLPAGTPLNCFACLPPWHISGLMPWVRSRVCGGTLFAAENGSFRETEALPDFRKNAGEFWMNSLVPTQLRRLLARRDGAEWLGKFDFILLGGARVPANLITQARAENLSIGIGYGMTETASLVALWRPENGDTLAGTPLPHAKFFISGHPGRIEIEAASLGETLSDSGMILPNPGGRFLTNDEGFSDENGRLIVLGRADRYINSGGEKADPAIVENALRAAGAADALVVGEPDEEWGERVVALVCAPAPKDLSARVKQSLPAWMIPKRIISVPALPFDGKGKLDRVKIAEFLRS